MLLRLKIIYIDVKIDIDIHYYCHCNRGITSAALLCNLQKRGQFIHSSGTLTTHAIIKLRLRSSGFTVYRETYVTHKQVFCTIGRRTI